MNSDYKVGDLIYDANIYDAMNTNLDDWYFYKRWLPENKDARILELCCGTGRLTLPIAKEGYDITGIDYTPSMLAQAKIKASEAGLEISFIEADIRTLNLPEKYDFIFIPFNSIHHLCACPSRPLSVWREKGCMQRMHGTLLQACPARTNATGNAFFRTENVVLCTLANHTTFIEPITY